MCNNMNKTNTNSNIDVPCSIIKSRQKILINLAKKQSGYFWFFMDNLSCKLDGLAEIYEKSIEDEYKKEYSIIDLSGDNKILHIGCGAYPVTDITLANIPGIKQIVGIDKDLKTVKLTQTVIDKKKLRQKIMIEHADGRDYPVKKFDVIIISSCSYPFIKILEHIFKTAKKQSKIVVRELDLAVKPVIRCINSHKNIAVKKRLCHHSFPFFEPFGWQTFYLQKK